MDFRPGQKEIVEAIISKKDTVALMPTGGGKSLCYQLPAVVFPGLTVVISPLIALMKDQVDALSARGIASAFINSSLSFQEIGEKMKAAAEGKIKLLYVAPERLASAGFQKFFSDLKIDFLAVDEAHCVSQWGHDFRPDYLQIKNHINSLGRRPIIGAFTATATPEVKNDIISRLGLLEPEVFVRGFDRPNLKFFCESGIKPIERRREVLRIINSISGSGIVYALSRKETENLAAYLQDNGVKAAAYHAGMENKARAKIQNDFMENKARVIVATIAFGMGVDKADVRFVIHSGMPGSLEGYYQEAGRAGRDGESAWCILLHSKKDSSTHKFFIRKSEEDMYIQGKNPEEIRTVLGIKYDRLQKMEEYVLARKCRRRMILKYFSDPQIKNNAENCKGCDVCLKWKPGAQRNLREKRIHEKPFLSATVRTTVDLYKNRGYLPEQIAKIRGLSKNTIFDHLVEWYQFGGELEIEKLVSPLEQSQILKAMEYIETHCEASLQGKLSPIKERLPEEIGYEKIKLVVAKVKKESEGGKAYRVDEIRKEYPNAYESWEVDDDAILKKKYAQGVSLKILAEAFGRGEGAIRSRLKKLGLIE